MTTLTYSKLQSLGTLRPGIALNSYQLRLLGIVWPPKPGWVSGVLDREIPDELFRLLMELRGLNKKSDRATILATHGITPSALFHRKLKQLRA